MSWFALGLIVSSSVVPLPDPMAEHRTYLASIGFILCLISTMELLRNRKPWLQRIRWGTPVLVTVWAVLLAWTTMSRNEVWSSEISLWQDTVAKSPEKARPWNNLAVSYHQAGRMEDSVRCFNQAIKVEPHFGLPYRNLALLYAALNRHEDAVNVCRMGIKEFPDDPALYFTLGVTRCEQGYHEKALRWFNEALAIDENHSPSHIYIGMIHRRRHAMNKALEHLHRAEALRPHDTELHRAVLNIEAEARGRTAGGRPVATDVRSSARMVQSGPST